MEQTIGIALVSVVLTLIVVLLVHHFAGKSKALAAAEKKLEDYADAELVKLAGDIVGYLSDTTPAQTKIAEGQADMARQAHLLAQIQTKFAAAKITAA